MALVIILIIMAFIIATKVAIIDVIIIALIATIAIGP